jgi:hypothetical protein
LILPVNTRSGAPHCEACRAKSFVSNQYRGGGMKVYYDKELTFCCQKSEYFPEDLDMRDMSTTKSRARLITQV